MATDVEICNKSLREVNANTIESLTQSGSREAEVLNDCFAIERDALLRMVDWSFARKGPVALTQLAETSLEWDYLYSYPSDCLEFREIFNSAKAHDDDIIPWERGHSATSDAQIILTDEYEAYGIYTKKITNSGLFDPLFVDVLSLKLQATLAYALHANEELRRSRLKDYYSLLNYAAAKSKNERFHEPDPSSGYLDARS